MRFNIECGKWDAVWLSEMACCENSGSEKARNFLISYNFIAFSRSTLLHVDSALSIAVSLTLST